MKLPCKLHMIDGKELDPPELVLLLEVTHTIHMIARQANVFEFAVIVRDEGKKVESHNMNDIRLEALEFARLKPLVQAAATGPKLVH